MVSGADVPVIATQAVCPHHVLCTQVQTCSDRLQTQQGVPKTCESSNGINTDVSSGNAVFADDEVPKIGAA